MDSALQTARYVSVATFRKDGREVATPVWCAVVDGKLCFYTVRDSGKLKRIRRSPRVKVAPCDARGRVLGAWSEGTARIVADPAEAARVYRAAAAKYGWQYHVTTLLSWITGGIPKRVVVEVTV